MVYIVTRPRSGRHLVYSECFIYTEHTYSLPNIRDKKLWSLMKLHERSGENALGCFVFCLLTVFKQSIKERILIHRLILSLHSRKLVLRTFFVLTTLAKRHVSLVVVCRSLQVSASVFLLTRFHCCRQFFYAS